MYVELETPPLIEKNILNFHFDYLHPSLRFLSQNEVKAILGEFVEWVFSKAESSSRFKSWRKND